MTMHHKAMTQPTIELKHTLKAVLEYIEKYQIAADSPEGQELSKEIDICGIALKPLRSKD
jgi:hypothetical protein